MGGRFFICRRKTDRRRGATAVEMALLSPAFFLLLIGGIESCLLIGAQQVIENATYNTSRLVKTGATNGASQATMVAQQLNNELASYGNLIDTTKVVMTEAAYNSFTGSGSGTGGSAGYGAAQQIVVYNVTYPWKIFTPMMSAIIGHNGVVNLTSTIVVRNEPYS